MKFKTAAARRRPNIQWEAVRASFNGLSISAGRATGGWGVLVFAFQGGSLHAGIYVQRTCSTGQKLVQNDINWVEGIESLRLGAVGDSLSIVSFAKVP